MTRFRCLSSRAGFALPTAIACIILIAVLATAALFASTQETRATSVEILDQQASAYAELVAQQAIKAWDCAACDALPVGGVIAGSPATHPPLESTVYTTKLDSALFLVVAEGRIVASGATRLKRRIAIAVRTARDSLGVQSVFPLAPLAWSAVYQM
jgi:type II secretory pathway pseudopilin PulG